MKIPVQLRLAQMMLNIFIIISSMHRIKKDSITISVGSGMLDMNSEGNALLVTQNNLSLHSKSDTSIRIIRLQEILQERYY